MLLQGQSSLGSLGPWGPAKRYWRGNEPERDIVAQSLDGRRLLLGEARWRSGAMTEAEVARRFHELMRKGVPPVPGSESLKPVYALFAPEIASQGAGQEDRCLVDAEAVVSALA